MPVVPFAAQRGTALRSSSSAVRTRRAVSLITRCVTAFPSARAGRTKVKRCAVSMMLLWQLQSFSLALVGNVTLASFVTRSHHLSLNSEPVYCATGKSSRWGSIWVFSDFCEIKVYKH